MTQWATAISQQLLSRHGVVTREAIGMENIPGGFSTLYPVLKAMEDAGKLRRGYFVAGLGATQFALPGAIDLLRSLRDTPDEVEVTQLSATDPANPYGATLKWPAPGSTVRSGDKATHASGKKGRRGGPPAGAPPSESTATSGRGPTRSVGATVILVNGALAAHLARGDRQLLVFLPDAEPERSKTARAIARTLIERAREHVGADDAPRGMLIEEIDGVSPTTHALAPYLSEAGFIAGAMGFQPNFRVSPA
jgi:ATP-dependent Lhr-like helicase